MQDDNNKGRGVGPYPEAPPETVSADAFDHALDRARFNCERLRGAARDGDVDAAGQAARDAYSSLIAAEAALELRPRNSNDARDRVAFATREFQAVYRAVVDAFELAKNATVAPRLCQTLILLRLRLALVLGPAPVAAGTSARPSGRRTR